jgi:cell division GTPase FtsZ
MSIQIVGLGSLGSRITDRASQRYPSLKNQCLAIDSDSSVLDQLKAVGKTVLLGEGEGCLGVYDMGVSLLCKYEAVLRNSIDKKVVLVGACGATSLALGTSIIKTLKEVEILNYYIYFPLPYEGERRLTRGKSFLKLLEDGGGRGTIKYTANHSENISPLDEIVNKIILNSRLIYEKGG